ncbi:MAG: LptF/LptG family permease [Gemmataceae bacterium]|nr:LptF/LptG family permease [Gemmataceae bacterium]
MTKLLDRMLVYNYLKAYLICLVSLLALYIVVDLFANMDDFTQHHDSLAGVLQHIARYYGVQVTVIFDRLCEVIVLLAAMFTVAWIQRNNELVPLLSAGVSTHRVVRPVLFSACLMMGLSVVNQEIIIPRLGQAILFARDDPEGERDLYVTPSFEPNRILISSNKPATRKGMLVREFTCTIPEDINPLGELLPLQAAEARYVPPQEGKPRTGGWRLTGATIGEKVAELPPNWARKDVLELIAPGNLFLYTSEVDFDVATRDRKWFYRASTMRVFGELGKAESNRLASMAVVFHMRLTRPILGILLVFLGLSVILRDQNRNVFISAGLCLGLCALFFAVCFGCRFLGEKEFLSPALAAWLPVLLFGPLSFAMFDAIHT